MRYEDFDTFVGLCRGDARPFFDARGPITITRAPGRIDVMGGVADYSGSLVLEGTIAEAAFIGLQTRGDDLVRVWSHGADVHGLTPRVEIPLSDLCQGNEACSYEDANARLSGDTPESWAAYIVGAYHVLAREGLTPPFSRGANILLKSAVPMGGGVSSSAALEIAAMCAICEAYGVEPEPLALARLCQIVENRVVGAACGIMDQVTIALGEKDSLLALRCQPHEVEGTEKLPEGWRISGINSRVKRFVKADPYRRARCGAFMGRRAIDRELGPILAAGYLCNLTPRQYRETCRELMADAITGEDFLAVYGNTDDPITSPEPDAEYAMRVCTEHPIYENARVAKFRELMAAGREGDESAARRAGLLMYASHWSYSRIGLGCDECDLLVGLARERGPERGIYGAKISGGGAGGTVVFLTGAEGQELLPEIADEYEARTKIKPQIMQGSSPGALGWGVERLTV